MKLGRSECPEWNAYQEALAQEKSARLAQTSLVNAIRDESKAFRHHAAKYKRK